MRARRLAARARDYARPRIRWRALIPVALFGLAILYSAHQTATDNAHWHQAIAAEQRQAAAEQAGQRRAGLLVEQKLCATLAPLSLLADLQAPAGNPAENPSRAFEQRLARRLQPLAQLGSDIGCNR